MFKKIILFINKLINLGLEDKQVEPRLYLSLLIRLEKKLILA
jgi:hypothetical protein